MSNRVELHRRVTEAGDECRYSAKIAAGADGTGGFVLNFTWPGPDGQSDRDAFLADQWNSAMEWAQKHDRYRPGLAPSVEVPEVLGAPADDDTDADDDTEADDTEADGTTTDGTTDVPAAPLSPVSRIRTRTTVDQPSRLRRRSNLNPSQ